MKSYDELPEKVKKLLNEVEERLNEQNELDDYAKCKVIVGELRSIGWNGEYGLDGEFVGFWEEANIKAPKRKMDWESLVVESVKGLSNGWAFLPEGTMFFVESSNNGLHLRSKRCECCNIRGYITKVPISAVRILDIEYNRKMIEWNEKRRYVIKSGYKVLIEPNELIPNPGFEI